MTGWTVKRVILLIALATAGRCEQGPSTRAPRTTPTVPAAADQGATLIVTSPVMGQYFAPTEPVVITAKATPEATVARVEFFANANKIGVATTAPYRLTYTSGTLGAHTITARAILNTGTIVVSLPVRITISEKTADAEITDTGLFLFGRDIDVAILQPAHDAVLKTHADIKISAEAVSRKADILQVTFNVNERSVGTRRQRPFEVVWSTETPGTYKITAHVVDSAGYEAASEPLYVRIQP